MIPHRSASAALANDSLSIQEAREFNEFPVYWLGESSQGLSLTRIIRYLWTDPDVERSLASGRDDVDRSQDLFGLNYGTCTVPEGLESCPVPLQVDFTPYCKVPPDLIADRVRDGDFFELRRAKALWTLEGTTLHLWTGTVHVQISSPYGKDVVQSAAEELVSLNHSGTESRMDDLPAEGAPTCPPKHPLIR